MKFNRLRKLYLHRLLLHLERGTWLRSCTYLLGGVIVTSMFVIVMLLISITARRHRCLDAADGRARLEVKCRTDDLAALTPLADMCVTIAATAAPAVALILLATWITPKVSPDTYKRHVVWVGPFIYSLCGASAFAQIVSWFTVGL